MVIKRIIMMDFFMLIWYVGISRNDVWNVEVIRGN